MNNLIYCECEVGTCQGSDIERCANKTVPAVKEIERLRRVEMIAREIAIDMKNVIYNHHDELASKFLCDLAIAEMAKRLAKLKAALDNRQEEG